MVFMKKKPSCTDLTTEIETLLFLLRDGKSKTDAYLSKKIGKNYNGAMMYVLHHGLVDVDYDKTSMEDLMTAIGKCLQDSMRKMILKCSYTITDKGLTLNRIINKGRKK